MIIKFYVFNVDEDEWICIKSLAQQHLCFARVSRVEVNGISYKIANIEFKLEENVYQVYLEN